MVDPAFFYERNQEGAGFFCGFEVEGVQGLGVGVGLYGGGGGEDDDVVLEESWWRFERNAGVLRFAQNDVGFIFNWNACVYGRFGCGCGSGLDDSYDWDGEVGADFFEGQGGGGVAGYDEEVGTLSEEKAGAGESVADDGLAGFGAVGEPSGVAEVDVVGAGDEGEEIVQDGEAAEAGVKDTDGEVVIAGGDSGHGWGLGLVAGF